ncbi:4Fe-4S dicluster domain-containing protein [Sulfurospirillum arcachonense]|uniref:4Fe-4S dicluster domain-containing protein n=1 Tax=Sulfurospirillum arcachonense TaxID=57666 RepID=UPI00046811F9|nr:4Fe-4S dicluster domain-containing protein [Sulfurospirillum arcachonense]
MLNLDERTNKYIASDPHKCIGCHTCMSACYESSKARGKVSKARLIVYNTEHGTLPNQCHQCDDAPCANICPVGALSIGLDCIELAEEKCIGCKMCTLACPFGCIEVDCAPASVDYYDQISLLRMPRLDKSVAIKCDLCQGLEGGGHACVDICPTEALIFVTPTMERNNIKEKAIKTLNI